MSSNSMPSSSSIVLPSLMLKKYRMSDFPVGRERGRVSQPPDARDNPVCGDSCILRGAKAAVCAVADIAATVTDSRPATRIRNAKERYDRYPADARGFSVYSWGCRVSPFGDMRLKSVDPLPQANRLLNALPQNILAAVEPHLMRTELSFAQVLAATGQK